MSDYSKRAEEILAQFQAIGGPLHPEEDLPEDGGLDIYNNYRDDIYSYMRERNNCMGRLLELIKDDNSGNSANAEAWKSTCEDQAQNAERYFKRDLGYLSKFKGHTSPAGVIVEQREKALNDEQAFFSSLALVNAAWVRDRLVKNREGMGEYTEKLRRIWEELMKVTEDARTEQQQSYQDVVELAKEATRKLAEESPLLREKLAKVSGWALSEVVAHAGDIIAQLIGITLGIDVPEGSSTAIEIAAEDLGKKAEEWAKWNKYLEERMQGYLELVRAQEGTILPAMKEIRQQVYDYWNEKGTKASRVWIDRARESLDGWKSACTTSGQKDDADQFSADVYSATVTQWSSVESIGKAFEETWSGIFLGPLQPTAQDKLTDAVTWNEKASSLIDVGNIEPVEKFLSYADETYGVSVSEPLSQLEEVIRNLPTEDESKSVALQAFIDVKARVISELAIRFEAYKEQIRKAYKPLERGTIVRVFDRSDFIASLKNDTP